MNFQVGDLLITKENKGKKTPAVIIEIHPIDIEFGWKIPSATIEFFDKGKIRLPLKMIEDNINEPPKREKWYHFPVS